MELSLETEAFASDPERDDFSAVLPSVMLAVCGSPQECAGSSDAIALAFKTIARLERIYLVTSVASESFQSTILVAEGTKLSKLRQFSRIVDSDFVCVCDPDLGVRPDAAQAIVSAAIEKAALGSEVAAYGLVECRDNGTLLSRVIAIDKWLSHRVLRPALWKCGLGITIPGQFLVLSTSVLKRIDPAVDSYLDDLYLGWIARSTGVRVLRFPLVVGVEESRTAWISLLTQRLRWMRGFFSLVGHLFKQPKAIGLLAVHFAAYHGLPIAWLMLIGTIAIISPVMLVAVLVVVASLTCRLTGQSLVAAATFSLLFPLLHLFATLFWWVPIGRQRLQQR